MKKDFKQIPSSLMQQWESEAMAQGLSYLEVGNFIRMKERMYREGKRDVRERPQIFANAARNKLTAYGNDFVLDYFLQIPVIERTCKIARIGLDDLRKRLAGGFVSEDQRENFLCDRSRWFSHLRERMKDLRISKEMMESYGLSWKDVKTFAYQAV